MGEQMCRTCLATCGELVPIFSNEFYVHNLPDKLLHTTKIEVLKDDPLPKMMCKKCIFLVDSLYCFIDQCEMAEMKLKKTLKNSGKNNILIFNDKSDFLDEDNLTYDLKEDDIMSDMTTSSEEDYHIEYASEEARIEVENARIRSRKAKKIRKKYPALKVKSVEILPIDPKNNTYKKVTPLSYKSNVSEIDELVDDKSSMCTSDLLRKYSANPLKQKNKDGLYCFDEKINFFKNKEKKFKEDVTLIKLGTKRKLENNNGLNQLAKVPKKVIFKENEYNDENVQLIKINDNQINTDEDTKSKNEINLSTVTNINASQKEIEIENACQNDSLKNDSIVIDKSLNAEESSDLTNISPDDDTEKVLELRTQNLKNRIVLNIPEVCTICLEYFESYLDVLKHKIETHLYSDQGFFHCQICQAKFSVKNNLLDHVVEHDDLNFFVCILCSGNFYTEESLRTHLYSHVDVHDMICHICSKKFLRNQTLLNHLIQHISKKLLFCILCTENNFKDKNSLQNHIIQIHKTHQQEIKFNCQKSGLEALDDDKKESIKCETTYPCAYCNKIFTTKTILRDHVLTHLGKQQYSCLVCDKTFSTQDERTQHMQDHMKPQQINDQKKFRCRVCHEILVSRIAYGQHLKDKHWSAKQTSEILQELSDSSMNEKINDQFNKSSVTPPASESIS